jgi:ATP-dependent DNA ligase
VPYGPGSRRKRPEPPKRRLRRPGDDPSRGTDAGPHACAARPRRGEAGRTALDWTHKYPAIAKTVAALDAREAYLDGELCGVGPDGITMFNIVQLGSDRGNAAVLVFFLFDLLYLYGEDLRLRPLIERKERLGILLANAAPCLHYSGHVIGQGPTFYEKACAMHVEGIVSKPIDAPYTPGNRRLSRKVKCLNRAEFVVVGWTDPKARGRGCVRLAHGAFESPSLQRRLAQTAFAPRKRRPW